MSSSQYFVFQPGGNEWRELFWHTMLFCLIPNFQVDNKTKTITWKKELNSLVSESSTQFFFIPFRQFDLWRMTVAENDRSINSLPVVETVPHNEQVFSNTLNPYLLQSVCAANLSKRGPEFFIRSGWKSMELIDHETCKCFATLCLIWKWFH